MKKLILIILSAMPLWVLSAAYVPDSLEQAVLRDGLLPLILVDGNCSKADMLQAIAQKGYVVFETANAAKTIDEAITQNKYDWSECIDDEYVAALHFGDMPASADSRISTQIWIDGISPELKCSGPVLCIVQGIKAEAVKSACQGAASPIAVASTQAPQQDEQAEQILLDWLGWMFKGQSNKRSVFVSHDLRQYPEWEMDSRNFLTDYEYEPIDFTTWKRPEFDSAYPDVHDPVLACEDGVYYMFTTGFGIGMMSSADGMKTWRMEESPLNPIPEWAKEMVPAYNGHTWAPDIVKSGDSWYLYYSCSTFGKNISAIGVMTSRHLDPARADWTDLGVVVRSQPGITDWNAIDPNVNFDEEGNPWLTFGSFWDGIQLVQLDSDMKTIIGEPKTVARRRCECKVAHWQEHANTNAIEAPFILKHDGMYYLFASYDYCCQGVASTYKTAVGRSCSIAGPYLDRNGKDMADLGGDIIIGETKRYAGVGHCAVYDLGGKTYFIAHAYDKQLHGRSKLFLSTVSWVDGWPVIDAIDSPVAE